VHAFYRVGGFTPKGHRNVIALLTATLAGEKYIESVLLPLVERVASAQRLAVGIDTGRLDEVLLIHSIMTAGITLINLNSPTDLRKTKRQDDCFLDPDSERREDNRTFGNRIHKR
jgi:hypothetical protein